MVRGLPDDVRTALVEECRTAGQETSEVIAQAVDEAKSQLQVPGMTVIEDVDIDALREAGMGAYEALGLMDAYETVRDELGAMSD